MIENYSPVSLALFGGGITFAFTALGSALVFFFMSEIKPKLLATMYGFAAGVMTAASFWSLLAPSIELSENTNLPNWLIPVAGFLLGAFFIWVLDKVMPHMHIVNGHEETEGTKVQLSKSILLFLAITLHNIPEGISIAVPIYFATKNKKKAILLTFISGFSEFFGAVLAYVFLAPLITSFGLGVILALAAGIMIHISIYELIPTAYRYSCFFKNTIAFIIGFFVMLVCQLLI